MLINILMVVMIIIVMNDLHLIKFNSNNWVCFIDRSMLKLLNMEIKTTSNFENTKIRSKQRI